MGRILLVDDNEALVSLYSRMLASEGHIIKSVLSGRDCLDEIDLFGPDLILLDILMEPMDGWEVLEKIRNTPGICDIPVIILSAKFPQFSEMETYSLKIDDYILKPVMRKTLCGTVNDFLAFRTELDRIAAKCRYSGISPAICEEYKENARFFHVMKRFGSMIEPDILMDIPDYGIRHNRMPEIEKIFEKNGVL